VDDRADTSHLRPLFIVTHSDQVGGAETFLLQLLDHLDPARFRPTVVVTSPGPLYRQLRARRHDVIVLPLSSRVARLGKHQRGTAILAALVAVPSLLAMLFRLWRLLRASERCVVLTFSIKADVYGAVAAALAGRPCVWYMHDLLSREMFPAAYRHALAWLANRLTNSVLCNSAATRQALLECGVRPALARVAELGVETSAVVAPTDLQRVRRELGAPDGPVLGLIGRIAPWKGQHVIVDAAPSVLQAFPNAVFWLVGGALFGDIDTSYEAQLRRRIQDRGLGRHVILTGHRYDVPAVMACCDVVLHTSVQPEPFGLSIVEAMALGKPVIATRCGAVPELIDDGRTGLLVPPGDAPALANAILRLLRDPEGAKMMGSAARKAVEERFSIEASARRVGDALQRADDGGRGAGTV